MENLEKRLFKLVDSIGEILEGDLHIIDMTPEYNECEGEKEYRAYLKDGYCFDIKKEAKYDDETGKRKGWYYFFYSEWDGFEECTVKKAIEYISFYKMVRSEKYG